MAEIKTTTTDQQQRHKVELTRDCFVAIISFLTPREITKLGLVSKQLATITGHESVWLARLQQDIGDDWETRLGRINRELAKNVEKLCPSNQKHRLAFLKLSLLSAQFKHHPEANMYYSYL